MDALPTVLVVRPRAQAAAWVDELARHGVPAAGLPLIDIRPAPDARAVRAVAEEIMRGELPSPGPAHAPALAPLLVFVSANAVEGFFEASGLAAWPAPAWAAATGPGTTRALREAGVPAGRIASPPEDAASFDSEALWRVIEAWPWAGRRTWIVRGNGGREWLAERLREAGAQVAAVQAYERAAPELRPEERARLDAALAEPRRWAWLFSSSEAIDRLRALAPAATWADARALATHARIAEHARAAGFGTVELVVPDPLRVAAAMKAD